jgi:hypothetical protein
VGALQWEVTLSDEEILARLLDLNQQRAALGSSRAAEHQVQRKREKIARKPTNEKGTVKRKEHSAA